MKPTRSSVAPGSTSTTAVADWEPVPVPCHWRTTPAFAGSDGPLLYRRRFEHDRPGPGERLWLVLDGLFYQGDVWLDGAYVGDTEGYFVPHEFEITEAIAARAEHVARRRGDLRAAARPAGQAQHHRRVPALGLPRPGLEPGRHLAAGPGGAQRARADQVAAGAVPRGLRPSGRWSASGRSSTRRRPARSSC